MMIVKSTSYPLSWPVYHRSNGAGAEQYLNMTDAVSYGGKFPSAPTSSSFYISENDYVNKLGETYVAYLFAHDTSSTGIIQCGSFNNNPSGISSPINLGWEPQFLLMKNASSAEDWYLIDTMRRFTVNGTINYLNPNTSSAENAAASSVALNSTGFQTFGLFAANSNIIYMAIRMPNKPPTTGTQVYNGIARTGTGAAATVTGVGFAPDAVLNDVRYAVGGNYAMFRDKLRGGNMQVAAGAAASEQNWSDTITAFLNDGINLGVDASTESINKNSLNYINWFLKRAPGFFDVVCYTGSGGAANITHGLGVTPELVMVKSRSQVDSWCITSKTLSPSGQTLRLNGTEAWTSGFTLSDSSTVFSVNVSGIGSTNAGGQTYVAYLFATLAGISKVGSYTGNGGSQAINCGFTSGARFVLIKRTDNVGSWYVWDTARSINPGNEPHLSLNTSDGEVTTDDSMDYDTNGFVVNQVADTNVNVTSATYIYLAIA
jgi:hypothetical protein